VRTSDRFFAGNVAGSVKQASAK